MEVAVTARPPPAPRGLAGVVGGWGGRGRMGARYALGAEENGADHGVEAHPRAGIGCSQPSGRTHYTI